MNIDSKLKVLFAIYSEYQKDIPNMKNVNYQNLKMDSKVFRIALLKLDNEKLINGLKTHPPNEKNIDKLHVIMIDDVMPSKLAIDLVEEKFELAKGSDSKEKLKKISTKLGLIGAEILKEFVINIL